MDRATGRARPPGWTKSRALVSPPSSGRGGKPQVVVFLDADVRPTAGLIADLARRAAASGGLVSVQPWHRTERVSEQLGAPFNAVTMMAVGTAAPPWSHIESRGAFGPVLATTLEAYRAAGGRAAVRGDVIEDVPLAERYRTIGGPVEVSGGRDPVGCPGGASRPSSPG